MSIIDGKGLVTWEGGEFEENSDLLRRVQWAFTQIRAAGGTIILNEAGRPFGVPGDMNVRNASQTASGVSTVWFQWGRYLRGETPSAANPNAGALASEHTQGKAIDCNAPTVFDATLRAKYFAMVGMKQTIPSESWHWAIRSAPSVDLAAFQVTPIKNNSGKTPQELEDEMGRSGIYTRIQDGTGEGEGTIFYQDSPLDGLYPLDGTQWGAAAAQGNVAKNFPAQEVQALMRKVGVVRLDPTTRRVVRDGNGNPIIDFP